MTPPTIKPTHTVFAHELDLAWIIALWLAVHHGDPVPEGISKATQSEQTEVLVRALSGHLQTVTNVDSAQIVEKLAKLGMEVSVEVEGKRTHVKNTKQYFDSMDEKQMLKPHKICTRVFGFELCHTVFLTHLPKT
jgi:hypothetical protein